ncbi:MAG: regulatory protein GemA [Pseudomonadota bacterium]
MISNDKKAVIHIAKAQTGMTEEEYRDLLSSVGVASSKDLNNKTFDQVMSRFEALGFKTTSKTRKTRKVSNLPKDKRSLMKKLEAIILSMNLTWAYVDAIARKRFGKDAAHWLEGEELFKLVQMMAVFQKRNLKVTRKRRA